MRKFIASDPRIAKYEPLVRSRALTFHRGWLRRLHSLEDLQALGRAAIWDAILTWRKDGGANFGTYVTRVMMHAFLGAKKLAEEKMRRGITASLTTEEGSEIDIPAKAPSAHDALDAFAVRQAVRAAVDSLEPRRKELIERRFWRDETLEQIGATYGVSRERIRQMQEEAFQLMRPRLVFLRSVGVTEAAQLQRAKRERQGESMNAYKRRIRERRSA